MNSSTTSKDLILEVKDLNIMFNVDYHRTDSMRGKFTELMSHPYKFFFHKPEKLHVIRNLNLNVYKGDRIGILGVNGAGKSSFCRCVAGMYAPHSGKVSINGECRAIFETSLGVMPELTGRENAYLISRLMYPQESDIDSIVEESLEFSELKEFVDTPFKHYSKGMQARLMLSLVSARPSDLLILDEVYSGADAYFSQKITKRVLNLIKESAAVLFVSHSEDHVRSSCNKVIIIYDHKLIYEGDVEEGIRRYNKIVRAAF